MSDNDNLKAVRDILEQYKHSIVEEFADELEKRLANNADISAAGYQSVIADICWVVKKMKENRK